ncbi:hypothetical protein [Paenibacillus brasilensis]|uniref:Uncharacterized protein n=1 Tax=Paenibacillus brasilensis TaxID=128574 RepID=A0ABU0KZH7_9BACL|nr:hypothetical protein [Paenibacillus brasilensis]MDQ0494020.1 hypothetical protein [Paenibacillus brasilensis]
MIWRWWRKRPVVVTKDLKGLSVLTDEHLDYLAQEYGHKSDYGLIKSRISFGCYVELTRKILWEG